MTTESKREWPTDELRQVLRHQRGYLFSVQRRWLVADGEPYSSELPRNPEDCCITDRLQPTGSLVYFVPRWVSVRKEWRDLPWEIDPDPADDDPQYSR